MHNLTDHSANLIKISVQEAIMMGYIEEKVAGFLVNKFPPVPILYILPKMHIAGCHLLDA